MSMFSWFKIKRAHTKEVEKNEGLVEGIDMPDINCVTDARPTKPLMHHRQSKGRGLRPKSDAAKEEVERLRLALYKTNRELGLCQATVAQYKMDIEDRAEENERLEARVSDLEVALAERSMWVDAAMKLRDATRAIDKAK